MPRSRDVAPSRASAASAATVGASSPDIVQIGIKPVVAFGSTDFQV